jgi:hypothetical protein
MIIRLNILLLCNERIGRSASCLKLYVISIVGTQSVARNQSPKAEDSDLKVKNQQLTQIRLSSRHDKFMDSQRGAVVAHTRKHMQMHLYLIYLPHVLNFPLGYFIP